MGKTIWELAVIYARIALGSWMIVNGLNHWIDIFPQPLGNNVAWASYMVALIDTGMFGLVKFLEIIGGAMLIFNIFVPLALMILMPLSAVIIYNGGYLAGKWFEPFYMGTHCFYLNAFLMVAYAKYYFPMLGFNADPGTPKDLAQLPVALRGVPASVVVNANKAA
ncbi:MAG: DoxX family membrane protein [Spongiibacteraceae bacterium]|jgi:hypothetical protein|nr:DoxX family membrane protein [Spongiibacteraceae bacterium]